MRNALVVLVPVCIGLTSGFIVPSSIQEVSEDNNFFHKNGIKTNNILRREAYITQSFNAITESSEIYSLGKGNEILKKEIFELSRKKDFNLTERSFIYIKKRTKNPLRDHFYIKQLPKDYLAGKNNVSSYLVDIRNILQEMPRRFSVGYVDKNILDTYRVFDKTGYQCKPKFKSGPKHILDFFGLPISEMNFDFGIHKGVKSNSKEPNILERKYDNGEKIHFTKDIKRRNDDEDYGAMLYHLLKKSFENLPLLRKNNLVTHNGFHYCRDCVEKTKTQGIKHQLSIIKQCKCGNKKASKHIQKEGHYQNAHKKL